MHALLDFRRWEGPVLKMSYLKQNQGFPGGAVDKNQVHGDIGWIPGPGGSQVLQSNSLWAWAHGLQQEQSPQGEAGAHLESSPHSLQLEEALSSHGDPVRPQKKYFKK